MARRRYVPGGAYRRPGPAVKAQAIAMYIEGSSLSAIGRVLGYSAPAVYCSDRYAVYRWFPQDRHCAGKGGAVNRNEGCIRRCGAS